MAGNRPPAIRTFFAVDLQKSRQIRTFFAVDLQKSRQLPPANAAGVRFQNGEIDADS